MVSFTPPAPKIATVQKFGRQPARGPIRGFLNAFKIMATDFYYPKVIGKNLFFLALFAVPLMNRESFYRHDSSKGAPWDRIIAEKEKEMAKK
jgi:hypothetical protein